METANLKKEKNTLVLQNVFKNILGRVRFYNFGLRCMLQLFETLEAFRALEKKKCSENILSKAMHLND